MKKIKLFCFPYAGGSSIEFRKWRKLLSPSIELIPIEYPGRGKRFTTPLCDNINKIVEDVFQSILIHLDGTSFSFFGHSMGTLVAFELAHKLKQSGYPSPVHIFFSGRLAPHLSNPYKPFHTLKDAEFKEELFKLGGTPLEALENKDWMSIFFPIIKSDFKAVESYRYTNKSDILDCEFTILYGDNDYLINSNIDEWQEHTKNKCTFLKFNGAHFFVNEHTTAIVNLINSILISKL